MNPYFRHVSIVLNIVLIVIVGVLVVHLRQAETTPVPEKTKVSFEDEAMIKYHYSDAWVSLEVDLMNLSETLDNDERRNYHLGRIDSGESFIAYMMFRVQREYLFDNAYIVDLVSPFSYEQQKILDQVSAGEFDHVVIAQRIETLVHDYHLMNEMVQHTSLNTLGEGFLDICGSFINENVNERVRQLKFACR